MGILIFDIGMDENSVEAANTLHVGPGQTYLWIQDAIDAAKSGDTIFVYPGTYYEDLLISKTLTLKGAGIANTTINGNSESFGIEIRANEVIVSNFLITGSRYIGIYLNEANNCRIYNVKCFYNWVDTTGTGIYLLGSSNNVIVDNEISFNGYAGLSIIKSDNNYIENNTIVSNNWNGLYIEDSDYNIIHKNTISSNKGNGIYVLAPSESNELSYNEINSNLGHGIYHHCSNNKIMNNQIKGDINIQGKGVTIANNAIEQGIYLEHPGYNDKSYYDSHVIINNTINGKPIYYFKNSNNAHVPIDAGSVILVNCNYINIDHLAISGASVGIQFAYCDKTTVNNSVFSKNEYGIDFIESSFNSVLNCEFIENNYGVHFYFNSIGNLVENCELIENTYGLYTTSANNNVIKSNNIYDNLQYGFYDYLSISTDARDNWWGSDSGPHHATENPNGTGDDVTGDLLFFPWRSKRIQFNKPPVITTQDITTVNEDEYYQITYEAFDPDYDRLTWSFESNASWLNWGRSNHTLYGKPTNADVGRHYVNIRVDDPNYKYDVHNFNVDVINVAPAVTTIDITETNEDFEYYNDYNCNDDDQGTIIWDLSTNASWLRIDEYDGVLRGIPLNKNVGSYWVNVTVSDGNGGFDVENFTLTVFNVNDAPRINKTQLDFSFPEDTIDYSINLNDWFTDVDSNDLVFRCERAEHLKVEIFDNGTVKLKPELHWNGKETLIFFANDSIVETPDNVIITVLSVNDPPYDVQITLLPTAYYDFDTQPATGSAINFDEQNGDILTFTWSSNLTGLIGYGQEIDLALPAGNHNITLNVTDSGGAWSTDTKAIQIFENPNLEKGNGPTDNNGNTSSINLIIILIVFMIVIIIIFVLATYFFMGKPKPKVEAEIEAIPRRKPVEKVTIDFTKPSWSGEMYKAQQVSADIAQSRPKIQPVKPILIKETEPEPAIMCQSTPDGKPTADDVCLTCGKQLYYIAQKGAYYCYECKEYD